MHFQFETVRMNLRNSKALTKEVDVTYSASLDQASLDTCSDGNVSNVAEFGVLFGLPVAATLAQPPHLNLNSSAKSESQQYSCSH